MDDLKKAITFIRGSNPNRPVAALGMSAGALNALMLGTAFENVTRLKAVASWSGSAVNPLPWYLCRENASPVPPHQSAECLADNGQRYSPVNYVDGDTAPILLAHGVADRVPVALSVSMYAALQAAKLVPGSMTDQSVLDLYETAAHGEDLEPCAIDATIQFFGSHLGVDEPAATATTNAPACVKSNVTTAQEILANKNGSLPATLTALDDV